MAEVFDGAAASLQTEYRRCQEEGAVHVVSRSSVHAAPPVLFGAGDQALLSAGYLSVVGSRDLDPAGETFAAAVGTACARDGKVLVSGGARGADRISMGGCLSAGGCTVAVLADSLERVLREPEYRLAVADGRLALVTAVHPKVGFSVASAMARNKFIYCLSRYGLVVAASLDKGGTRAGAPCPFPLRFRGRAWLKYWRQVLPSGWRQRRRSARRWSVPLPRRRPMTFSPWFGLILLPESTSGRHTRNSRGT